MKRYLLYTFILTLLALPKQINAQCDLPSDEVVNTGSNMTVMMTPDFISSLPISTPGSYLVAIDPNGLVVGSEVVAGVAQTAMAVWGDDTSTSEIDGAAANASISFQLVDGEKLYDVEMPIPVSFTANGMSFQSSVATVTLNCQPPVLGCTDENADNYSAEATQDDGTCYYLGCMDNTACNFDVTATVNNDSCTYADLNRECNGDCTNDEDDDLVCDEEEILGCTDNTACNFDLSATEDDGSCSPADANRNCDGDCLKDADNDGTCDEDEEGVCTDESACNYADTPNAITDNTLCDYTDAESCEECVDGVSVVTLDSDGDGVCDSSEVLGCMDAIACNYDSLATDSASCLFIDNLDACAECSGEQNGKGTVLDNDSDDDGICDANEIAGCTDSLAINYDSLATDDDDSCIALVLGCMEESACNYNVSANQAADYCFYAGDCQTCTGENDGTGMVEESIPDNQASTSCDKVYTEAEQGSFSVGYTMNFSTVGSDVTITCELLDNVDGVNAYLWGMNPNFLESNVNRISDKKFSKTLSNQSQGSDIKYAFKFAMPGGDMAVTKYFDYTVGDVFCGSAPVCENQTVPGCNDVNACNYDATSNANDGSCKYEGPVLDCAGTCLNDEDGDAVCDEEEVFGCNIPEAENYNPQATENDDSCVFEACSDATACNYNASDSIIVNNDLCIFADEESCESCSGDEDGTGTIVDNDSDADGLCNDADTLSGCIDSTACNFNDLTTLNEDLEACIFAMDLDACATCSGEQDGTGVVVDNDTNENGLCDDTELGCTRPNAINFNEEAITNDGSCFYGDECVIPSTSVINTGSNMTVLFTEDFINSLSIDTRKASLIALTPDSITVGSVSVNNNMAQIALMGDDTTTPEKDGALVGESISIKLLKVYDKNLTIFKDDTVVTLYDTLYYDIEIPTSIVFEINGESYQTSAADVNLNCTKVLGCNDPNADNFNDYDGDGKPNALTGDPSVDITANYPGSCIYSCGALFATEFAIELDESIGDPVLSYKIKNMLTDQDFLNPDIDFVVYSNTFEFHDTIYFSGAPILRNESQTVKIPLYNDFVEYVLPASLSGSVRVTGSGSLDGLSLSCDLAFEDVSINTDELGCKEKGAYNYSDLVTIDNGMCVEALSVNIDKEDPFCSYDYGSAVIHVTGDPRSIRSNYTSDSLYNWTAVSGAISMQDVIEFEDGYAILNGLDTGEYIIGIKDSVLVKNDTLEVLSLDTFNLYSPKSIEVTLEKNDDGYLKGTLKGANVSDDDWYWLYNGVLIESYPEQHDIHYPREAGDYYVYVEDEKGCFSYSDSVNISTPFNGDLSMNDGGDDLFRLYPNPTELELNIDLAYSRDDATVVLTDVLGQQLQHLLVNAGASESTYTFDVSEYPSGLYFLRVNQGRSQLVKRFVKK